MARQNTNYQVWFRVDFNEVKIFSHILRRADPVMYKFLHARLLEAGKVVKETAVQNSSWSAKIPGAIRTRSTIGTISVYVDKTIAPNARPIEHGGLKGTFRHPVYNKGGWAKQAARPFLTPAMAANRSKVIELINVAIDETLAEITRLK
jgi:hypothetical protein